MSKDSKQLTKTPTSNKQIYRYQLGEELNQELSRFAKNHQYDHRKDFKNAWNQWREENDELFQIEIKKHEELGYQGEIEDKIFKSARYYFRKKLIATEKKAPAIPEKEKKTTNSYINVNKELLEIMDEYLKKNIQLKPAKSFTNFCDENQETIEKEIEFLYNVKNIKTHDEIKGKIKKTYKNRYYKIRKTYVPLQI